MLPISIQFTSIKHYSLGLGDNSVLGICLVLAQFLAPHGFLDIPEYNLGGHP